MQISQFIVGATYAGAHMFVSYTVPIWTPYTFVETVSSVVTEATSSATSLASSASSAAVAATATAGFGNLVKRLAWRAMGEEGLAENVGATFGNAVIPDMAAMPPVGVPDSKMHYDTISETRWRNDLARIRCLDTPGEAFAINLNVMYLLPLT